MIKKLSVYLLTFLSTVSICLNIDIQAQSDTKHKPIIPSILTSKKGFGPMNNKLTRRLILQRTGKEVLFKNEFMQKWIGSGGDANLFSFDAKTTTSVKSSYVIVSDSSFAPFVFQNNKNIYTGIDMQLIKTIAKDQGFDIHIKNPGFDAAINAVQSGQADGIIAGMSITEERKKTFDFSDPYYKVNAIVAVKKTHHKNKIKSYKDLKGKKIGVKNGTASQIFLETNKEKHKYKYNIKTFSDASPMYDSLHAGAIDAIMDDEPIIKYAITQGHNLTTPIKGVPVGEYGFAVKKGENPELISMFNAGLVNLKSSGKYQEILNYYFGKSNSIQTATVIDETTILGLLQNNYRQLLNGFGITISLALLSFTIAMVIGIIFGMLSVSPCKFLRCLASMFIYTIRGIPLMILTAFIFWGIPNLIENLTSRQSPINDFLSGIIALSLNTSAYISEIVRGGIQAVDQGQMEASRSLGISYGKTMIKIILPQATKIILPNFVNQFVITLKDTTIVSAIGLVELFQTGKIIIARNYQSFRMYAILAIFYLIIISTLTRLVKDLERKMRN